MEGTATRNHDRLTDLLAPRDALSAGLNGQLTSQTSIGFNVYLDRAPAGLVPAENGWLTRSTLRVVHTIATGSARVATDASDLRPSRGSGSVLGSVFADWNGNGLPDAGEQALPGIPVRLGFSARATTAHDGQFTFVNVPAGLQDVGLDLTRCRWISTHQLRRARHRVVPRRDQARRFRAGSPGGSVAASWKTRTGTGRWMPMRRASTARYSPSTRACDRSSRARAPFDSTPCAPVSITSSC